MKKRMIGLNALIIALLVGCVIRTEHKIDAHITLDIRHVQEQAEDVLDFIEGKTDALPGFEEDKPTSWLQRSLQALDPFTVVHAAEMKTDSPKVKQIATELRKNNAAVSKLVSSGCFGETNRGYVELQECDDLKDADAKNEAQQLLASENAARKALYSEIARLNKDDGLSVTAVEQVYAAQRIKRGAPGERYQLPSAGEIFNEIKASDLGKKLGAACTPGAWVTIP
tara:strand:- start:164 stop:841 length:678 start_codon:yes stop_codon:yes gene_type:complete